MGLALGDVQRAIASAVRPSPVPEILGSVRLFPHQREAAALLQARLTRYRGAVLADPVGTGKTYTALACATAYAHVWIIAPATLRATWRRALAEVGRDASFTSMESLSRTGGRPDDPSGGLVIVDEAHHFRNPRTQRYAALAELAWGRHLLLLTATPIHNAARDLDAMFALFADPRTVRVAGIAQLVVWRQSPASGGSRPRLAPPSWLANPADPALLRRILTLPTPVPLEDGGVAQALGVLGLVRLWASSHAALAAAVRRRRAAATAIRALVESGGTPSAHAVRACLGSEGLVQLPLALFTSSASVEPSWLTTFGRWYDALDELAAIVESTADADETRFALVLDRLNDHRGTPAVLFSHSIDTARAMYRYLAPHLACAGLWGTTTRVAGGRATREDVLRLMRPGTPADRRMPLEALIATDVVGEGIDLHAAGVLVHLDLPWTAARLAQRAGRLCRHGSPHVRVSQYAFSVPPCGERQVRILQRLCRKAQVSRLTLGIDPFAITFPGPSSGPVPDEDPGGSERLRAVVRAWDAAGDGDPAEPVIAAVQVEATADCFVAVVRSGGGLVLLGRHEGALTVDHEVIASLLERAEGGAVVEPRSGDVALAVRRIHQWLRDRSVGEDLHLTPGEIRHKALRAIASLVSGANRLRRADLLATADTARRLVIGAGAAGGLRRIHAWMNGRPGDPAMALQALVHDLQPGAEPRGAMPSSVCALLLLTPGTRMPG